MDRGFLFGDGVYEVIPVFAGDTFREAAHIQRLNQSLNAIALPVSMQASDWHGLFSDLLERNKSRPIGAIYVQVTRGVGDREHVVTEQPVPTVFAMCKAVSDRRFQQGIGAITHEDIRWHYCDIKAITLLPNVLLRQKANQAGAFEAILLKDGRLTEGAASNVFIVKHERIKTPVKSSELLPGITRDLVVELAGQSPFPCQQADVSEAELRTADEVWITSSTVGIAPVITLDDQPVGTGKPGKCWQQMVDIYERYITATPAIDPVANRKER